MQRGIKIGLDVIVGTASEPPSEITAGRPVTSISAPTAHRARRLVYCPDLDGRADPGEIVWTWVTYEDDPTRGKDRPVLVVGRDRSVLLGLMVSSQERHAGDRDWIGIGSGAWDYEGGKSWVRLDRVLDVPEQEVIIRHDDGDRTRYYDRDHRDYHEWNDREDHSYRLYLGGRHMEYREFHDARPRDQRAYWSWRHKHPDRDEARR